MDRPWTIAAAAEALRRGQISSRELTRECLRAIDQDDEALGCVVARDDEEALHAADERDAELRAGVDRGPLHGVPIALKDIFATVDMPTRAQSDAAPDRFLVEGDSAVAERLREAGAVLMAKAATSEYALGLPDTAKRFPIPHNPWDPERWTGGSSSGSAGGVAAGFFLGSIGSDSGGSVRAPAAFCGVTGLKPSFGRVSRYGAVPLAPSLDHVGPVARTAADCGLLLQAIAGRDLRDESTRDAAGFVAPQPASDTLAGQRIGWVAGPNDLIPPAGLSALEEAVGEFRRAGAEMVEIDLPHLDRLGTATSVVMTSEAFGVHRDNLRRHWQDYGRPTRLLLSIGALFGADDYLQARQVLDWGRRRYDALFAQVDCVLTLTCGVGAPRLEDLAIEAIMDPLSFTQPWNGLGYPAISVPVGFDGGLPLGMQVIARPGADETVVSVASAFQDRTDWHLMTPPEGGRP